MRNLQILPPISLLSHNSDAHLSFVPLRRRCDVNRRLSRHRRRIINNIIIGDVSIPNTHSHLGHRAGKVISARGYSQSPPKSHRHTRIRCLRGESASCGYMYISTQTAAGYGRGEPDRGGKLYRHVRVFGYCSAE